MATKHFVTFFYPGSFFPETTTKELSSRDEKFPVPKGCYGYRIHDQVIMDVDGEKLYGELKNRSGMTFFGKKLSLADVKKLSGDYRTLISNMEGNKYSHVVQTRLGNFQPLDKGDVVVENY